MANTVNRDPLKKTKIEAATRDVENLLLKNLQTYKKPTLNSSIGVFQIFKSTFFEEHLRTAVSRKS